MVKSYRVQITTVAMPGWALCRPIFATADEASRYSAHLVGNYAAVTATRVVTSRYRPNAIFLNELLWRNG